MFLLFTVIYFILCLFNLTLSSSSNTLIFSAGPNSYVAFDSWRPCLNGYVRFDVRTSANDGTLAYIDDRGKFDFFYLKLIEGKLRLLFNLGNDRQALNVNMNINDDQWHTILIKRDGQTTVLSIDNGLASNSTITQGEDIYFGGSTYNEYQASYFYFGGIPAALERPSSGNLSSYDVYMQPRFRGRLRNLVYKNCSHSQLVQPVHIQISGGVSLTPNQHCTSQSCGTGICLITDSDYKCLCDETDYYGDHCQYERQANELTFDGKKSLKYKFDRLILSQTEIISFQFKTNYFNALLFQLVAQQIYIKLKHGQIVLEYRFNDQSYESSTKDLYLIDNKWHYVQIKRKLGQIIMIVDEYHLQLENDIKIEQYFNLTDLYIGGNNDDNIEKFHGCFKDIAITVNDNELIDISKYYRTKQTPENSIRCSSLLYPIEFLVPSSYISFQLSENIKQMSNYQLNISFYFQTYSSDSVLFYAYNQHSDDFLGFDLIDGFFYMTINVKQHRQREELFQQRFNDGQTHFIYLYIQGYQGGLELLITMDGQHPMRIPMRTNSSQIHLETLTIGGIDPKDRLLPNNYWSGIMKRGFIGCFSNLELNNEAINLTKYINYTNNNLTPKVGPCSALMSTKRECSCEHNGECRLNNGGTWQCDCSKTGYTGRLCEQAAHHIDLKQVETFEFNTNMQWSEEINDISFGIQTIRDQENFLQIRPCQQNSVCDSISFSIINGLLHINFRLSNLIQNITGENPFLLDTNWHYIHLYRLNNKLLLHIDHHISQQVVHLGPSTSSTPATVWIILNGEKEIFVEDLRLYDQSINSKFFLNNQYEQIRLQQRNWKPSNSISFYDQHDSYITIRLNDIVCPECQLNSIYFDFRTTELNGLILFANIQTHNSKISHPLENGNTKDGQYLVIKLVDGQLQLMVLIASSNEDEDEIHQIQTKTRLNDGHWHHISLHRASDYHLELIIDTRRYYLLTTIFFVDTIYFGRPLFLSSDSVPFNHINTLKTCLASLTINSRSINLREFIKSDSQIRNDCFLDSRCPLRYCHNTGVCHDRIKCDCQHTSFQGMFCTEMKTGYFFNDYAHGLIFDQPFQPDIKFSNYKLSFGMVTKSITNEILRVSDQIQVELHRGFIRINLAGNMQSDNLYVQSDIIVNDGFYHLVQIEYNSTGYFCLKVDNKPVTKQLMYLLSLDKPLLLLIGQNPSFRNGFQGQLYGLQSDSYSVFDMISTTFHRISYSPIHDKTFSSSYTSPILYSPSQSQDDTIPSFCSTQSYDDVCIITASTNLSPLSYPNVTVLKFLPTNKTSPSSRSTIKQTASQYTTTIYSTTTSTDLDPFSTSILLNMTNNSDSTLLIISNRTSLATRFKRLFLWRNIWFVVIPILVGIFLCILFALFAYIKYRRKDVGVYEVEEAQRFRPLIVELPPSPGERYQENVNSTNSPTTAARPLNSNSTKNLSKMNKKSHKNRKRKSPFTSRNEQREFYI